MRSMKDRGPQSSPHWQPQKSVGWGQAHADSQGPTLPPIPPTMQQPAQPSFANWQTPPVGPPGSEPGRSGSESWWKSKTSVGLGAGIIGLILGSGVAGAATGAPAPSAPTVTAVSTVTATATTVTTAVSTVTATASVTSTATVTATVTAGQIAEFANPAAPTTTKAASAYYANCSDAKAAGVAPLHRNDPGYRSGLDRDNDGMACE